MELRSAPTRIPTAPAVIASRLVAPVVAALADAAEAVARQVEGRRDQSKRLRGEPPPRFGRAPGGPHHARHLTTVPRANSAYSAAVPSLKACAVRVDAYVAKTWTLVLLPSPPASAAPAFPVAQVSSVGTKLVLAAPPAALAASSKAAFCRLKARRRSARKPTPRQARRVAPLT